MAQDEITKVHCFFEQSGTFKKEFQRLGFEAEDYDIQNNFGETDHVVDLFVEIERAYDGKPSIFDDIRQTDLIMAFFPCIYFCALSQMSMSLSARNYRKLSIKEKTDKILERSCNRETFFRLCVKMCSASLQRGIPLIMENPWSEQTFLKSNFITPQLIDNDRTKRGDYYRKPTAYWFFNRKPTCGQSFKQNRNVKSVLYAKQSSRAGLCSEERSLISPTYARNFICDFIIGQKNENSELTLF